MTYTQENEQVDRSALLEKIRCLKADLAEERKTRIHYLQNVAHELIAPLAAIKWSIEALTTTETNVPLDTRIQLLRSVYSQSTILVHLVNNFSLMSNLEADHEYGNSLSKPSPVQPYDLCVKLASDFRPHAAITGKKIKVDKEAFESIFGHSEMIVMIHLTRQAITNLILNALKYADSKTTIVIEALRLNKYYGIRVASQGIPIEEGEKELIFGRNYRGSEACQKVPAGTGIGLFLVRHIMRLQSGQVHLVTRGRYSAFTLLFPDRSVVEGEKHADTIRR